MKIIRLKTFFLIVILILSVLAILPFFINPIAQKIVEQKVYPVFENRLTIGSINISFLRSMIELHDIALNQPPGFEEEPFLKIKSIKAGIWLFPLLNRKLLIRNITIGEPQAIIIQSKTNRINTDHIFPKKPDKTASKTSIKEESLDTSEPSPSTSSSAHSIPPAPAESDSNAFTVHLDRLIINNATITQFDQKIRKKIPVLLITDLTVEVNHINFPNNNDTKTTFNFKGNASAPDGPKAPITCNGEGVFLTGDFSLTAKNIIENLNLSSFHYFMPQSQVSIESGTALVTSDITVKEKYLNSTHHVKVKNLQIASSRGSLLGMTFFDIPAAGLTRVLEVTNGGLEFDFEVKGYLKNLKFKYRETIIRQIAKSISKKVGQIARDSLSTPEKARDFGIRAKDSLKKLFKFK